MLAGLGCAPAAHARATFDVPSQPLDKALIAFALQAGVSVGGSPGGACTGFSRALQGRHRPAEALRRLLPEQCAFVRVDRSAFRIVGAPAVTRAAMDAVVELEPVFVTAERRTEPFRGAPYAVSALSTRDLERLGASTFASIAQQMPAVALTNLGPARNKIFIRGLSDGAFTGRTQSTVGLYLDDLPISYNAPDPNLRLIDVARVEVLRGPQGTLYGSGSVGGIVRIVTRDPDPSADSALIEIEGQAGRHRPGFGLSAMGNHPLGEGAAVRVAAYVDKTPGYLDNIRLSAADTNGSVRYGGRAALQGQMADWTVGLVAAGQETRTRDAQYVQIGRDQRTTRVLEPHDNAFGLAGLRLRRKVGDTELRASVALIGHDLLTRYDATGAFDLGPFDQAWYREQQRIRLTVAEASATGRAGRGQWLLGAFASHAEERYGGDLDARASGGAARSLFRMHDDIQEGALYGEVSFPLSARAEITAGGRLFATRVQNAIRDFQIPAAPPPAVEARVRQQGFAPKLRLSYRIADGSVYVQAQDGYRAGGFNIPAQADGVAGGPGSAGYDPDRLHSYEAGLETALWRGRLRVRTAAFLVRWRDVQTDQFRSSGLPLTVNIGDAVNHGVELELDWRPNRAWRVRFNGLLNDPRLTRTFEVFPARIDTGLPGVARSSAGLEVSRNWSLPSGWRIALNGQASYVGRSLVTFDGGAATKMGDYTNMRLSAELRNPDWRAELYVDNVLNSDGNTFAYGNPFRHRRDRQATPLAPRTVNLSLARYF